MNMHPERNISGIWRLVSMWLTSALQLIKGRGIFLLVFIEFPELEQRPLRLESCSPLLS